MEIILAQQNKSTTDIQEMYPDFWLDQGKCFNILRSGRSALKLALLAIGMSRNDSVMIVTTTGGSYVSSCVTKTIEEVCQWSHELKNNTRVVLLIHEFGFPCLIPEEISNKGLTIIEDCAYAVGTRINGGKIGMVGDYAIYSLTKYYPIPFGGILVSRKQISPALIFDPLTDDAIEFVVNFFMNSASKYENWNQQRRTHWHYFSKKIEKHGLRAYFDLDTTVVPGVFVAYLPSTITGSATKDRCVNAGIESTEYYGQGGFYFPVHQYLTSYELEYILHHFLNQGAA
jgi:dTDP-4-amino-4,6-dideoxygalactose transaminase